MHHFHTDPARAGEYLATVVPACRPARVLTASGTTNRYASTDPRSTAWFGFVVEFRNNGETGYVLWRDEFTSPGTSAFKDAIRCVYLVDDGSTVSPYYVAGYGADGKQEPVYLYRVQAGADLPRGGYRYVRVAAQAAVEQVGA